MRSLKSFNNPGYHEMAHENLFPTVLILSPLGKRTRPRPESRGLTVSRWGLDGRARWRKVAKVYFILTEGDIITSWTQVNWSLALLVMTTKPDGRINTRQLFTLSFWKHHSLSVGFFPLRVLRPINTRVADSAFYFALKALDPAGFAMNVRILQEQMFLNVTCT